MARMDSPRPRETLTPGSEPSAATPVPTTPPGGQPRGSESSSVESGKQKAGELAHQAQEKGQQKAGEIAQQAQEKVQPRLEGQKEKAAQSLATVAHALRQTGQQLRQEDQGALGQYTDRGAEQIDRVAGYLRERDTNQLMDDAEQFARRQPALFLGGAFALGVFGARFLKSSRRQ